MEKWTDDMCFLPGKGMVYCTSINIGNEVSTNDKKLVAKLKEMDKKKPLTVEEVRSLTSYKK